MSQTPSLDLIHHHLTDFDPAASMICTLGVRAHITHSGLLCHIKSASVYTDMAKHVSLRRHGRVCPPGNTNVNLHRYAKGRQHGLKNRRYTHWEQPFPEVSQLWRSEIHTHLLSDGWCPSELQTPTSRFVSSNILDTPKSAFQAFFFRPTLCFPFCPLP